MSLVTGLTRNRAETDPHSPDRRLRGRTYAISFDRVWNAAVELAGGGLRRWTLISADDEEGVIRATALSAILGHRHDVRVRVRLDENAQTRVDVLSVLPCRRGDWGANARRIHRFLGALDARLNATSAQILDSSRQPQFTA